MKLIWQLWYNIIGLPTILLCGDFASKKIRAFRVCRRPGACASVADARTSSGVRAGLLRRPSKAFPKRPTAKKVTAKFQCSFFLALHGTIISSNCDLLQIVRKSHFQRQKNHTSAIKKLWNKSFAKVTSMGKSTHLRQFLDQFLIEKVNS